MNFLRFSVFLYSFFGLACNSQSPPPTASTVAIASFPLLKTPEPRLEVLLRDYDRYFSDSLNITQTPGAVVVIVKDSSIVFCKGYGVRALGSPELTDPHTVFRIGSLSKGFAGALTAVLMQENRLKLSDRVTRYFPEFALKDPAQTRRIQLTHLLAHCTGLPYHTHTDMVENGYSLREMLPYIKKVKIYGKEGTLFCYQNAVFSMIGEVMQGATGQTYQQLLQEKIFVPAGMQDASVTYDGILKQENKASPHISVYNGWAKTEISNKYYNAAPAGGVNASGTDMGQWLKVLLGNKPEILNASALDSLFYPRIRTHSERRHFRGWSGPKSVSYALGWRVLDRGNGQTIMAHSGFVNDFRSEIALDREAKIGICVLFNGNSPLAQRCIPAFFERWGEKF
jgi:beta-lactamase class C